MTDDIFTPIEQDNQANHRKAIRYRSSRPYRAIITLKKLLRSKKYIHAEVINLSSKGARLSSRYKFSVQTAITLNIKLRYGEVWKVRAKIVRLYSRSEFGIIFDEIQHNLIDQIMEHEADLKIT